ncbi:YfiR family protein [Vibrio variabilis]|uniref:YfiR family protein n=1 Tax=Vibrio variabilis TaxID=990271 RepID=UPI0013A6D8C0|nr:YfiR family protein [Vibrio variabilis]
MITILWLGWEPSRAWAAVSDDQLKAVYLYRFPMLADWPTAATGKVTHYCITRESSIGDYLSQIIASKSSSARFVDLSQSDKSQTEICHILYVDGQDREHVVELAKRYPYALTIGTGVQFVSLGGMLAFIKVNNRIKPLISQHNVEKSGVRLRAQLLAISELAEEK